MLPAPCRLTHKCGAGSGRQWKTGAVCARGSTTLASGKTVGGKGLTLAAAGRLLQAGRELPKS